MNLLITNHSSSFNLGDASILESLTDAIRDYNKEAVIYVLTNYPPYPRSSEGLFHFKNPFMLSWAGTNSIEAYRKADGVIVRGGDYFSDLYGSIPFFIHAITPYPAVILNKPMVFFGHSFGPFAYSNPINILSLKLLKAGLQHSQLLTVREEESISQISSFVDSQKSHVAADSAFLLKTAREEEAFSYLNGLLHGVEFESLVGINASAIIYQFGFTHFKSVDSKLQQYVKTLARFSNYVINQLRKEVCILFIPHVIRPGNDDLRLSELVIKEIKFKKQVRIIRGVLSPRLMKAIIGRLDFFLATRMHAMIHSISCGIPTLGISYSHKVKGLMRSLKLEEYFLGIEEMNYDKLIEKFGEIWLNRNSVRRLFRQASKRAEAEALIGKKLLFDWLDAIA